MKTKFKIIIPASIAVILIALMIIFNVPYNLNKSLLFNISDRIIISVVIMKNVNGRAEAETEDFVFEKESIEFASINELLDEYSYSITIAKDVNKKVNGNMITITIFDDNNSSLFLINATGANVMLNGKTYRMRQDKNEELIEIIMNICGM